MIEPTTKRTIVFVDGQNLFHSVRAAFGYRAPNYDIAALAASVSSQRGWELVQARFYTGVPLAEDDADWHRFWEGKIIQMNRDGVWTYTRPLRYRNETVMVPGYGEFTRSVASEKGIDIRIALDIVSLARKKAFDVALVFSQDQDLSEVAEEIRAIAREQDRWIKMASAFPVSPVSSRRRGINGTDWIRVERAQYDACLDRREYLSRSS